MKKIVSLFLLLLLLAGCSYEAPIQNTLHGAYHYVDAADGNHVYYFMIHTEDGTFRYYDTADNSDISGTYRENADGTLTLCAAKDEDRVYFPDQTVVWQNKILAVETGGVIRIYEKFNNGWVDWSETAPSP